jgi:hypothetical protein
MHISGARNQVLQGLRDYLKNCAVPFAVPTVRSGSEHVARAINYQGSQWFGTVLRALKGMNELVLPGAARLWSQRINCSAPGCIVAAGTIIAGNAPEFPLKSKTTPLGST